MIKRILVGLGGTPFNTTATQYATQLADLHQAQLTGVTVISTSKVAGIGPVPAGANVYAQRLREKKEHMTREGMQLAIDAFKASCSAQHVVCRRIEYEQKDTFAAMIAEARYNDLTIFGLRSLFEYGFVEDPDKAIVKLMTQGVRPILTVAETYRPVKKVLLAYSGSMESAKAIRHYLNLNPWPEVNLHIVHFKVKNPPEPFLLKDAAEFCQAHGFEVQSHLIEGQAHTDLLPFADSLQADLIVMGNSSRNALYRHLLGDAVMTAIRTASIPLFLSQ